MEKQKVFWVVLAVSVFVVVVLIVGVLLLRQHPGSGPRATVTPMNDNSTQVYEYQKTPPAPGTGPQAGAPSSGDQQTMHFYIGEGAQPSGAAPGTGPGTAPAGQTPGTSQPPGTVQVPGLSQVPGQTPAAPAAPGSSPLAPVAAAPAASAPATVTPTVRPRTTKAAVIARTPRKSAEYWIQTGSYKSQSKAEELVTLLEGKGLGSRMFSYNLKGDTFYRVRVGPYTNRGEADKFLGLVKQVQGLETSYISLVPAPKNAVN